MYDFLDSDTSGLTAAREARGQLNPGDLAIVDQLQAHVQAVWASLGHRDHAAQAEGAMAVLALVLHRAEALVDSGAELSPMEAVVHCVTEVRMALAPLIDR